MGTHIFFVKGYIQNRVRVKSGFNLAKNKQKRDDTGLGRLKPIRAMTPLDAPIFFFLFFFWLETREILNITVDINPPTQTAKGWKLIEPRVCTGCAILSVLCPGEKQVFQTRHTRATTKERRRHTHHSIMKR